MNRKESGSTFIGLNGDEPPIFSFRIKMHNRKRYKALSSVQKRDAYLWVLSQMETLDSWASEILEDIDPTPTPAPEQ